MDKAITDFARADYARCNMYIPQWDQLVSQFKLLNVTFNVTKRWLTLGTADSVTGWFAKHYSESTIEIILILKGSTPSLLPPGTYVRTDALGLTADPVEVGDEIETDVGEYYEVKTVRQHWIADSFHYNECNLTLLPFPNLTGGTYTTSTVEDARYRNKVYLQTWLNNAALPNYIVAYGEPDYPLIRVFKDKAVDLVYSLGEHTSDSIIDSDHYPIGYKEHVPITTLCIDKTNIEGTKLMHQAETELRRVAETQPLGSLRALTTRRPQTKTLGSTTLYSAEYIMEYQRDKT